MLISILWKKSKRVEFNRHDIYLKLGLSCSIFNIVVYFRPHGLYLYIKFVLFRLNFKFSSRDGLVTHYLHIFPLLIS